MVRFTVTRSSRWEGQPCKEAVLGPITRIDIRTFKSAEEYDKRFGHKDKWIDSGTNHRKYGSGIARDFDDEAWWIEINTLDELLAFRKKYGPDLVLRPSWENPEQLCIEIYDGYRE